MISRILIISAFSLSVFSCSHKNISEANEERIDEATENLTRIDVSVADTHETGDFLWYNKTVTPDTVYINPTSWYFDEYTSTGRLDVDQFMSRDFFFSDYISNPIFDINIINDSDIDLAIKEMEINIAESRHDDFPYLYFVQFIENRYGLVILNESWKNWGTMIMEYSFPHHGEKFDGKYKYRLEIPYFEDRVHVDFYNDIIKEGFDSELVDQYLEDHLDEDYLDIPVTGHGASKSHAGAGLLSENMDYDILRRLAYPFEFSTNLYTRPVLFTYVYGRISFTGHPFEKEFKSIIFLSNDWVGGANDDLVDEFDIEFLPNGRNYSFTIPYKSTLPAGTSERIRLTVKCSESSHHDFTITVKDSNGRIVATSKPIHFYNVNGRHSSYHLFRSWEGLE